MVNKKDASDYWPHKSYTVPNEISRKAAKTQRKEG
jgi:hypothetical protein